MKKLFLMLFIGSCILSCKKGGEPTHVADDGSAYFGEKIDAKNAITYDQLLVQLNGKDTVEAKVLGNIEGVCQVKGCWMNIVSEDKDAESMFVKFKDYGFFMPLDAAGKNVVMRGKAYREVTSVDELRHYAEDEGQSAEEIAKITEPMEELKFLADGVVLLPASKQSN